jgi:hypothetical protein
MTVDELSSEHLGWEIKVKDSNPVIDHRTFVLIGLRKWSYQGETTVALVDASEARPGVIGAERHYAPETECQLLRQLRKPRRRRS